MHVWLWPTLTCSAFHPLGLHKTSSIWVGHCCTGQWLILKSFCGPKVRGLKTKQGYGESVGQSRAPWLGGLEGHNPDDHLRTRFDTISLWPAISSLMMQRLVGRQLHLIYNGTQIWTKQINKLIKRGIICKQLDITCAHCCTYTTSVFMDDPHCFYLLFFKSKATVLSLSI